MIALILLFELSEHALFEGTLPVDIRVHKVAYF